MKKLLFALLMAAGLLSLAPTAEAGRRDRHSRHDHYDRHSYGHGYRSYYRPRHVYYHAPVRYSRSYYRDYDHCAPRYYYSRPRLSFSFGF